MVVVRVKRLVVGLLVPLGGFTLRGFVLALAVGLRIGFWLLLLAKNICVLAGNYFLRINDRPVLAVGFSCPSWDSGCVFTLVGFGSGFPFGNPWLGCHCPFSFLLNGAVLPFTVAVYYLHIIYKPLFMGHSVHAFGFRLNRARHWVHRLPYEGVGRSLGLPLQMERLAQHRLRPARAPFLVGGGSLRQSPFGFRCYLIEAQFTPLQRLLVLLRRRSRGRRQRPFHPLALVENLPVLPPAAFPFHLASLWVPFLRWRFGTSWAPLLASSVPVRLLGLRRLPPSTLLCRFLLERVRTGLPLGRLVASFLATNFRRLTKAGVLGLLLRASGRFTRSQMATTLLFRRGRVPLGTVSLPVDQVSATTSLKYGACTLTLWLCRSPSF